MASVREFDSRSVVFITFLIYFEGFLSLIGTPIEESLHFAAMASACFAQSPRASDSSQVVKCAEKNNLMLMQTHILTLQLG